MLIIVVKKGQANLVYPFFFGLILTNFKKN